MAEVSDADLAILQNSYKLLKTMEADPRSKPLLESAVKIHHPDIRTSAEEAEEIAKPYLEKVDATEKRLQERLDALEAREKSVADAAVEQSIASTFQRLQGQGFTADGIEKIKTIMVERNIADPEAAAALFEKQNPPAPAEQPGWVPDRWNIDESATDNDVKSLFANEDKWADKEVAVVLNEIRLGKAS